MQNATKTAPLLTPILLILLAFGIVAFNIAFAAISAFLIRRYLPTVWAVPTIFLWVHVYVGFVIVSAVRQWPEKMAKCIREKSAARPSPFSVPESNGR